MPLLERVVFFLPLLLAVLCLLGCSPRLPAVRDPLSTIVYFFYLESIVVEPRSVNESWSRFAANVSLTSGRAEPQTQIGDLSRARREYIMVQTSRASMHGSELSGLVNYACRQH